MMGEWRTQRHEFLKITSYPKPRIFHDHNGKSFYIVCGDTKKHIVL